LNSSRLITLFSSQPASNRAPTSFLVSVLAHCLGLFAVLLSLKMAPRIDQPPAATRYTVRILQIHTPYPQIHVPVGDGVARPEMQPATRAARTGGRPAAPPMPQHAVQPNRARFTLLQPDVPPNTLLPLDTPIPLVVLSSPAKIPTPKIVPPPPQKVVANLPPALTLPNREAKVADLKLSTTAFVTDSLPMQPSTTTPIAMHGLAIMKVPETTSSFAGKPTPTTVVVISDVVMTQGTVALPLANETAAASIAESLAPGRQQSMAKNDTGNKVDKQDGQGGGDNSGGQVAHKTEGDRMPGQTGAPSGGNSGSSDGDPLGNQSTVTRITLPRDGRFGVVVVGSSLAEEYPETLTTWANRLAYTVYLHVGAAKNWILQYSLPSAVEAAGRTTRPEAPWPYLIVRPNLAPGDQDSDAILVHGVVNGEGRFEQLAIVFPPQFPQTKFVLDALQQWQFRPASQDGRSAAVEILLIIPDASE